jgi:cyanate permease
MTAARDVSPAHSPEPYRWVMLAGIWLVYYCFGLVVATLSPLVKPITQELGISYSAMGSVLGAWPLIYIAAAIPCGALLDRIGLRRAVFLSAMIMGLSSVLRGFATDHVSLFLAVAVFGLGGPLISTGGPKLVSMWFDAKERGVAVGIYITGPALGNITAYSLSNSVLMPYWDGNWHNVMFFYGGFVLVCAVVWLVLSAHRDSRAFESRAAEEPKMSQLQVFRELLSLRAVQVLLLISAGIFFFSHGVMSWLPELLRNSGMKAEVAGYWASLPAAIGVFSALVIPRLAVPTRRLVLFAGLFVCAGAASLLLHLPSISILVPALVLLGIARGSMTAMGLLVLVETGGVGSGKSGSAGGLFFSTAEIGGVLGPLTIGSLYDVTGGFDAGLNLMAGVAVALMLLLLWLRRHQ